MHDFERGAKVTGSKFYFTTDEDAWTEWKLMTYMIEMHRGNGYQFVIPPYLVNRKTAHQSGILPRFEGDYYQTQEGLILVPTAETPMVGMHADEMLKEEDLPLKYVAFSPCFRKEAGAAGARDKGLKRVHQFHKIELFVICRPEDSERLHQEMVNDVHRILGDIELMYTEEETETVKFGPPRKGMLSQQEKLGNGFKIRLIELTPEDRAPWSNKTIDFEIAPESTEDWMEVSSVSNTGDNQTKTVEGGHGPIRYKNKQGKTVKCHLLNGSGVALPRLMLALKGKP